MEQYYTNTAYAIHDYLGYGLTLLLVLGLLSKQIRRGKFEYALLIFFVVMSIFSIGADYLCEYYKNSLPVSHLLMPFETLAITWIVAQISPMIRKRFVAFSILCIGLGITQELITQDLWVNNRMYSLFHFTFVPILIFFTLNRLSTPLSRPQFLAISILLLLHIFGWVFILFEEQCRFNPSIAAVVFPIIASFLVATSLAWYFVLYLFWKQQKAASDLLTDL
jgi:hypothetical protein